ncbi:MAG: hypothetical protein ACMXX8_02305 [Candidatus Woesearchaeota archaeon]
MSFVRKNISITEFQDSFIKSRNISLSKLVQKALDKEINDINFSNITNNNYNEMEKGKYEEKEINDFLSEAENW